MRNLDTIIDDVCENFGTWLAGDNEYGDAFAGCYDSVLDLCAGLIDDEQIDIDSVCKSIYDRGYDIDNIIECCIGTYPCIDEQGDLEYLNYDLCETFLDCLDCTLRGFTAYKDILNSIEGRFYDFFGHMSPDLQPSYAYSNSVGFVKMILECIDDTNAALKKYGLKELDRQYTLIKSMHTAHLVDDSDYYKVWRDYLLRLDRSFKAA